MTRGRAIQTFADAAPLFTALGDATRLGLVGRLCREGPLSISRLTDGTGISRQAVAKHLRVLSDAGIARGTRHGRESMWHIEARRLAEVQQHLSEISAQWDDALDRLKTLVEKEERQGRGSRRTRRR